MKQIIVFFKQLYQRIFEDEIFGLAAQLAYFFLLSLFPFLLFLITLIGYLPLNEHVVTDFLETYAPTDTMDLLNQNISQLLNNQNGSLLSITLIGTLWAASNAISALMNAFNRAYDVEEDRSFIVSRLIAIVLTIAMFLVICMAFLLPIFGKVIGLYIFSLFGAPDKFITLWEMFRWMISSIVFFIVFLALYMMAPNKRVYMSNAVYGAIFATICWQLVSLAFSYYVNSFNHYSAMHGSLGAVIILMIWFYITGIIIMVGGLINAIIRKSRIENLR